MEEKTINLGEASDQEALEKLGEAFDALSPGDTLYFVSGADPRKIIEPFMEKYWGLFNWSALQEGEGDFLSQIVKREQKGPNTILEMFGADHRRCDDLFARAEAAANEGDQEKTAQLFGWLEVGMEGHFNREEKGFFEDFDQKMGFAGGGPTVVMREDHNQIRGMMRRMAGALAKNDLEDFSAASETILYLMEQHNMKEEQMLYPMTEHAFGVDMEQILKKLYLF